MSWYSHLKISMPLAEPDVKTPNYLGIGHTQYNRDLSNYDYSTKNDPEQPQDMMFYIDNNWNIFTAPAGGGEGGHPRWDQYENVRTKDQVLFTGRYEPHTHNCSLILSHEHQMKSETAKRAFYNKATEILDRTFDSPIVHIYT